MKREIFIDKNESIKGALKKLNQTAQKVLLVVNKNQILLGAITDGDIRRSILQGVSLEETIENVYQKKPILIKEDAYSIEACRKIFIQKRIELIPIVKTNGKVINYITWEDAFSQSEESFKKPQRLNIPVVIMAGGKGTRLAPFTNVLPKALIPLGDKTIMELIIEKFCKYGIENYYLILNHRGEMIRAYFDGIEKKYNINYIWEKNFYGTAGSLKLLEDYIDNNFIVTNCDIIVEADYSEVVSFHKKNNAFLTVLSSIQHYTIPYGIVEFKKGGQVIGIREKPEYTFTINSGVYILRKSCLENIPREKYYNMTDMISTLIKQKQKVLTYPVNENDYIDIGQWEEYQKVVSKLQRFL